MFQELLEKLNKATEKNMRRTIVDLSAEYDDLMLMLDSVPEEGVDFLLKLFSDPRVLKAQGIEHFLLEINVDLCKYTQEQLNRILHVLVQNAGAFSNELSRHSVGDFIARAYPTDVAYETLCALAGRSNFEKHVAFVGFDVMLRRQPKESSFYATIERKWNEVLAFSGG